MTKTQINVSQEAFPKCLLEMHDVANTIHVLGNVENLYKPALAIVGARKATPYGLNCARRFARLAASYGIVVVSGGAIGCDQAAHSGALDVGGTTTVVLGCGADVVYPKSAKRLFDSILDEGGTIMSEAPWGAPTTRWGFRRRNRIIAGMALATLIVEAGLPSGTFSTADETLAQGKEVLAIPGSIFAKESKGANHLIAQGAIPIVDDESFFAAMTMIFGKGNNMAPVTGGDGVKMAAKSSDHNSSNQNNLCSNQDAQGKIGLAKNLDATSARVVEALVQEPLQAQRLVGVCGDNIVEVIRCLSGLEMIGLVKRTLDGRYSVTEAMLS